MPAPLLGGVGGGSVRGKIGKGFLTSDFSCVSCFSWWSIGALRHELREKTGEMRRSTHPSPSDVARVVHARERGSSTFAAIFEESSPGPILFAHGWRYSAFDIPSLLFS